jgi:hypothetical protein
MVRPPCLPRTSLDSSLAESQSTTVPCSAPPADPLALPSIYEERSGSLAPRRETPSPLPGRTSPSPALGGASRSRSCEPSRCRARSPPCSSPQPGQQAEHRSSARILSLPSIICHAADGDLYLMDLKCVGAGRRVWGGRGWGDRAQSGSDEQRCNDAAVRTAAGHELWSRCRPQVPAQPGLPAAGGLRAAAPQGGARRDRLAQRTARPAPAQSGGACLPPPLRPGRCAQPLLLHSPCCQLLALLAVSASPPRPACRVARPTACGGCAAERRRIRAAAATRGAGRWLAWLRPAVLLAQGSVHAAAAAAAAGASVSAQPRRRSAAELGCGRAGGGAHRGL